MPTTVTELSNLWNIILKNIQRQIHDPQVFDSFFTKSSIYEINGNIMTISASSELAASMFSTTFYKTVSDAVYSCTGTNYELKFRARTGKDETGLKEDAEPLKQIFFKNAKLDPRFTFDNFVVGESDLEAKQAATLIASNPGGAFNPLLIYGDSGLGKTHLIQAIGNAIKEQDPRKKVLYISAADFVDEFVAFVKGQKSDQTFSSFFRDEVDVFLLDDVQFLRSKEKTMETFFNVFQILANAKRQIVLTSDQDPRLLDGLDERLKTRFAQGLAVKVTKPDFETTRNILRLKIASSDLRSSLIDEDVIDLLSRTFGDNVRELEGALNRLLFYTINIKPSKHITLAIASEAIANLTHAKTEISKLSVNRIVNVVADYYGLTASQIMGKMRVQQIALARHISMYLCKTLLDMNYSEIGKAFSKDHTSVMNAMDKVDSMWKTSPEMKQAISDLQKRLGR